MQTEAFTTLCVRGQGALHPLPSAARRGNRRAFCHSGARAPASRLVRLLGGCCATPWPLATPPTARPWLRHRLKHFRVRENKSPQAVSTREANQINAGIATGSDWPPVRLWMQGTFAAYPRPFRPPVFHVPLHPPRFWPSSPYANPHRIDLDRHTPRGAFRHFCKMLGAFAPGLEGLQQIKSTHP